MAAKKFSHSFRCRGISTIGEVGKSAPSKFAYLVDTKLAATNSRSFGSLRFGVDVDLSALLRSGFAVAASDWVSIQIEMSHRLNHSKRKKLL